MLIYAKVKADVCIYYTKKHWIRDLQEKQMDVVFEEYFICEDTEEIKIKTARDLLVKEYNRLFEMSMNGGQTLYIGRCFCNKTDFPQISGYLEPECLFDEKNFEITTLDFIQDKKMDWCIKNLSASQFKKEFGNSFIKDLTL